MNKPATPDTPLQAGASPIVPLAAPEKRGTAVLDHSGEEMRYPPRFTEKSVSVSSVAREWGISSRRVRVMLTQGRLRGRQGVNGYWEVGYPYCYTFGTRGPALKPQQRQAAKRRKNPARFEEQVT